MNTVVDGDELIVSDERSSLRMPLVALRDRCGCADCGHPSGQRLIDPATFPGDLAIASMSVDGDRLHIQWSPEGHDSTYSLAELTKLTPRITDPLLWTHDDAAQLPVADHAEVSATGAQGSQALLRWLRGVARMGCGVLTGVPIADGEVARVAELFGFVRETNYGRWFDVRTQVDVANLANTSLGLPPHTDNPYRDPVPTMQLLHCHQSSAEGGDNVLVDGWRVAEEVRQLDPDGFAVLVSRARTFEYRDERAWLSATAPMFELDAEGRVRSVRCNHRSLRAAQAPTTAHDSEELAVWYRAYGLFNRLAADPRFQIGIRLNPGDLFIVDNRRVLHGRTAYAATAGSRHLQGCYADIDGLSSTIRVLERADSDEQGVRV